MTTPYNSQKVKNQHMTHKMTLKVNGVDSLVEFDMGEDTFNQIRKHCQDKYPEKDWKVVSNSTK